MLQKIERLLREECAVGPGAVLLAGVSGGPDSLCLVHVLHALGHRPIVAHFDHQLRPESASESVLVSDFASSLSLPFVSGSQDVGAYARTNSLSIEEAGRLLRYAFLFAQAHAHGAAAVAVGHTADDQAETVIMHLLRGAGLSGLSGMAHRVVLPELDGSLPIVRPLLSAWRQETLEYCRLHDLPALHDASNESREFLRNRVRLDLIPTLETFNPQIRRALWRLSQSFASDMALIEPLVTDAWKRVLVDLGQQYVGMDAGGLGAEPPALQRRLVMRAAIYLQPGCELGHEDLMRAGAFISDPLSRRMDLGDGLMLFRESEIIYVAQNEQNLPSDRWPQLPAGALALDPHSAATIPLADGWRFTSQLLARVPAPAEITAASDSYRGLMDADSLPAALELRIPESGDRIQPLGMQGHTQKLSDVFINIGVPERLRSRWPVLASGDTVIWIPGFRIAEPFRIRRDARQAVSVAVYRSD